ncbi:hypothetical protein [Nostoc sp. DedSLP04]|nr:hypothetical protein [Nostoc sp. DedSLP04]MDZ8033009.1 hypothetical protein [Nostoc sp. DedSLP04]
MSILLSSVVLCGVRSLPGDRGVRSHFTQLATKRKVRTHTGVV